MNAATESFTPPTSTSYPAVFTVVRESLDGALPDVASSVLDGIARTVAAKMDERQLAPAAYGDKRRPHYTHAAIGCDGVSVNLCFRDGSAEFVFVEEELEITREEGRDIYTAHVAASEVLALRQALIDYLPAAEGVEDRATPAPPSLEAMKAAVELEIKAAIGAVTTRGVGEMIDRVAVARVQNVVTTMSETVSVPEATTEERLFWLEAAEQHGFEPTSGGEEIPEYDPPAYFATADEVLKLMAAARQQGRKDVLDAIAQGEVARG